MKKTISKIITYTLVVTMVITILFRGINVPEVEAQGSIPTVGNSIYYGNYIQDKVTNKEELEVLDQYTFNDNKLNVDGVNYVRKNGNIYKDTPIEWQILQDDGECYVLMSKKILEIRRFSGWNDFWDVSEIREWLNGIFLNSAFTKEEQKQIEETTLSNMTSEWGTGANPYYPVGDEEEVITKDKVFLLSSDDVQSSKFGFESGTSASDLRVAYKTQYLDDREGADRYWLRGGAWFYGQIKFPYVDSDGSVGSWYATYSYGVRPIIRVKKVAMGLSVTKPEEKGVNTTFTDGSLDWNNQVANLFSNSALGNFELKGPKVKIGNEEFNLFKYNAEIKSPFFFKNTDLNVKYNAEKNTLEVLGGYNTKSKKELDKSAVDSGVWKDNWKNTKSIVIGAEKGKLEFGYEKQDKSFLDNYKETKEKLEKQQGSLVFKTEFKALAYFEFKLDENHNISRLLDGGLLLDGEIGVKARSYIWTIVYAEGSIGGELSAKIHAQYDGKKIEPKTDIELKFKSSFALGANAVVVDVQGGLKGEISGTASFPYKSKKESLGLSTTGKLFCKLETIIGLSGEYSRELWDVQIYPEVEEEEENISLSYRPAKLYAKEDILQIDDSNKIDTNVMESVVSDFARPQTIELEDGTILLTYLSDQEKGADGQNTLMYRVNRRGIWTDAIPVNQTNRMDTMAKLYEYDGTVYAIYQNSSHPLSMDMSEEEISKSMEIYVAEFDESTLRFKTPVLVGEENDYYKYNYLLCEKDGKLCAMWAENTDNSFLLQSGETKRIGCVLSDSVWSKTEQYGSGDYVYDEFICFTYNNVEQKLVLSNSGKKLSVNNMSYTASSPIQDMQILGNKVYYRSMKDNILHYFDLDKSQFISTGITVGSSYLVREDGVYWTEQDGLKNNIVYKTWEEDTIPVQITEEDGYISGFQITTIDDKETFIYTLQEVNEKEKNPYGATIMKAVSDFEKNRIEIMSVSYDILSYAPGEENDFAVEFTNVGNTDLHDITIKVKSEDGTELFQEKVCNEFKAGAQQECDLSIVVPSELNKGQLVFEISADEELVESAIYKKPVEKSSADIMIEKLDNASVKVTNIASQTAADVHVNVHDKSIDNKIIETYFVGNLESGAETILDVSECYDFAEVDKETKEKALYCEATQSDAEFNIGDNMVVLFKMMEVNTEPGSTQKPQETAAPGTLPQPGIPSANSFVPQTGFIKTSVPSGIGKVAVLKLKQKKRTVTASWKKTAGAKGYQICYSTSKKWKNKKQKLISKNKAVIKNLKTKKTYYFRVRAYCIEGASKVYGTWSTTKKIKIKK